MVGGPPRASAKPVPGTVTAALITTIDGSSTFRCNAVADRDGRFMLVLPSGVYDLSGRSLQFNGGAVDCIAERRVVVPGHPLTSSRIRPLLTNVDCQRR
jgi:hypothetical protein